MTVDMSQIYYMNKFLFKENIVLLLFKDVFQRLNRLLV